MNVSFHFVVHRHCVRWLLIPGRALCRLDALKATTAIAPLSNLTTVAARFAIGWIAVVGNQRVTYAQCPPPVRQPHHAGWEVIHRHNRGVPQLLAKGVPSHGTGRVSNDDAQLEEREEGGGPARVVRATGFSDCPIVPSHAKLQAQRSAEMGAWTCLPRSTHRYTTYFIDPY